MNSVLKGKRIFGSAIFLSVLGLSLPSCKKEDSAVGLGLQSEDDLLNATLVDTFSLKTYTELEDSVITDELSNSLLGSYVDPVFGKTTASIYTQLGLSNPGVSVNMAVTTVDSVRLQLRYNGFYGELDPQTFTVHRVTQKFYKDSSYYSTRNMSTDGTDLVLPGTATITPNTTANVVVGSDTLNPLLLLKLDPATIGTDILNGVAGGNLASETAFSNFFFGLRIGVNNAGQAVNSGGILYFNLADAQTKMVIYYTESGVNKQLAFPVGANQARFCNFAHDYTGTPVEAQLSTTSLGQKMYYTQSMAGVHGILEIPGLDALKNLGGTVIINRAELYLPVEYFVTAPYTPAGANFIIYKKSDGAYAALNDQADYPVYGGVYNDSKKAVVFNMARHVQRIVKGDVENLGFKIVNGATSVSCSRNIYGGQQSPNRAKPYLKVYYTKY